MGSLASWLHLALPPWSTVVALPIQPLDRHLAACHGEGCRARGSPLALSYPFFSCMCPAQREAILPQAMLRGSFRTQG